MTTIEHKEKLKDNEIKSYFDLGITRNVKEVLGDNCLLWFLPVNNVNKNDGYNYDIDAETYDKITRERSLQYLNEQNQKNEKALGTEDSSMMVNHITEL